MISSLCDFDFCQRFDPTYEAWKLLGIKMLTVPRNDGFDPTYEAWKLDYKKWAIRGTESFDPTYEAWKPGSGFVD